MSTRKVTVAQVIEAMRQNNIPHNVGNLVEYGYVNHKQVYASACALGQAAINLGATPYSLQNALSSIVTKVGFGRQTLDQYIVHQNDEYKKSPDKTAALVKGLLTPEQLAQVIEVETEFSIVVLRAS